MDANKCVPDETLSDAARNESIWQSGDYNAIVKLRGEILHRVASAMHRSFVETGGRDPEAEEIAHMKQLVVGCWNSMVCLPEGSDPFNLTDEHSNV